MKQIINLPGYSIKINEHEGIIVTDINPTTEVEFEETPKQEELNGVHILLTNTKVVSLESYSKQEAYGVILKTKHASIIISKEDLPAMTWDEAIKHNPFDRHEAIEIHNNKEQINKTLELIGGKPIKDEWYWTRDEYSTFGAWFYNGSGGSLGYNTKYTSYLGRAVTAF